MRSVGAGTQGGVAGSTQTGEERVARDDRVRPGQGPPDGAEIPRFVADDGQGEEVGVGSRSIEGSGLRTHPITLR
ncbi:MAG: hypothetical protein Q7S48_00560 [bacterium]|nr:hypothetical protein [bacterium]